MKINTPWGMSDSTKQIADGIIWCETPSHGGIWLSPARMAEMPTHYKVCSFTNDNWFEEDCSMAAVVLAFPQFFTTDNVRQAQAMYNSMHSKQTGHTETIASPIAQFAKSLLY